MLKISSPPETPSFAAHKAISKIYGVKAAGLSFLPPHWRLEFCALSVSTHDAWKNGERLEHHHEISELRKWCDDRCPEQIILRSSGSTEAIEDRGKFESIILPPGWNWDELVAQIGSLYENADLVDSTEEIGIVVQERVSGRLTGHLSNEYRVSPSINQWSYEIEAPSWKPASGINSKFATSPDPNLALRCGSQIPHQLLRSVAHYITKTFAQRCHVEWMVSGDKLILSQIDFDWPDIATGINPRTDLKPRPPEDLDFGIATSFSPYVPGIPTPWPKLQNLSEFDFGEGLPSQRIYELPPSQVREALSSDSMMNVLEKDMIALTGNRLVVRTDCIQTDVEKFNLPRTDTVNARNAIEWCAKVIADFAREGIAESNYTFLFHAFLPARAAAWAYAKPDNPLVIVDALWGLPDGLQVLPVDTCEINVVQGSIVATKTTYKPKFLTELDDGSWDYRNIMSRCGRHQVLSKADKLEIATRTARIATKLGDDAQIMWFCDIPEIYQVGRNLPWFRSREIFDPSPREEVYYRPVTVSKKSDLEHLPNEKVTLRLSPEANLIRNNDFLESVIEIAKERGLPVRLDGSILGHAFYRLDQEGVPVVLSNAPKYYRKRNRQIFGKLVRDKIPANITAGGETVVEAKLAKGDLTIGLAGKLLEEVEELLRATEDSERSAEIADILEVTKGLASAIGVEWGTIENLADKKAEKRGGFEQGRVLIETALPHRNSPISRHELVNIGDLNTIVASESVVEIPASNLLTTTNGKGVIFSFQGDPSRFRLSIINGRVQIAKLDRGVTPTDESQPTLF